MRKGSGNTTLFNEGALRGEPVGKAPVLGTPKDMPSKALEIGICFNSSPVLGNMTDAPFLGPLREG
jgi:hypothetical protein